MPVLSRRAFLAYALGAGAAFATGRVAGNVYHAEVTHHTLELAKLRSPLRVAQLSDLHYGPFIHEDSVARWVAQTQAEEPELIVITGDLVDRHLERPLDPLYEALSNLRAPLGVWACLGNHDRARFGWEGTPAFRNGLAQAGVTLLINEGARVRDDLFLAGVDDLMVDNVDLEAALKGAPGGAATLLMCHQPDVYPLMAVHVDLTLSGHTHGGQVRLPVVGTPVTSSAYGERYLQGWAPPPNALFGKAYVTRGLGVSYLPIRIDCPAELAVFDVRPAQL